MKTATGCKNSFFSLTEATQMRDKIIYLFVLIYFLLFLLLVAGADPCNPLPAGFVQLSNVDSTIIQEIRYYSAHNFVGRKITGYEAPECILTVEAAKNLSFVQQELLLLEPPLTLKVYDCYRPQQAVDDFYNWSLNPQLTQMQLEFYPELNKSTLFDLGYIARKSGHSRGSTIDLTLVPYPPPAQPVYTPGMPLTPCTAPYELRFRDNSIDMGTGFDCFDPLAHTLNPNVHGEQLQHRLLLRKLMTKHSFNNYPLEWWHYTLIDEPFPNTYFDFAKT
jgi:D-alanyl-D-alanine dipeptidase